MNQNLLSLQTQFQRHMLGDAEANADASPLLAGSAERRALGLAIYANAYRQRLVDALADAHAKTCAVLGAQAFEAAALLYIAEHPPTTRSLRWFGAGLASHLRTELPHLPQLAELAQLDWALRRAFDGPDSSVLAAADLSAVPPHAWANLHLMLVPTTELLRFEHNTVAVWQALDDEAEVPPAERAAAAVDWLVWRKGLQPHFRSLHAVEAALLRAMLGGASFAQACELAQAESDEDGAARIGGCLRQWLEDEVLSGVLSGEVMQGESAG